jgi:hypothetical protein
MEKKKLNLTHPLFYCRKLGTKAEKHSKLGSTSDVLENAACRRF